jgi:hypothetical protein
MQYLPVVYDNLDPDTNNRRMKCRPEHLEKIVITGFYRMNRMSTTKSGKKLISTPL